MKITNAITVTEFAQVLEIENQGQKVLGIVFPMGSFRRFADRIDDVTGEITPATGSSLTISKSTKTKSGEFENSPIYVQLEDGRSLAVNIRLSLYDAKPERERREKLISFTVDR